MRREASIPLFLWVATAALAHLIWGGGAEQGARLIDERLDVGRFAAGIRSHVRGSIAPPIEIALEDDSVPEEAPPEEKPPEDPPKDEATPEEPDDAPPEKVKPEPEKQAKVEAKPEEKEPEPDKKEPEK